MCEGTVNVQHASLTSYTPAVNAPYNVLTQAKLDINNGFSPFNLSGESLYLYNLTRPFGSSQYARVTTADTRTQALLETVASSGGTNNDMRFFLEMPVALNKRDPIGLINLQNPETVVTINATFGALSSLLSVTTGYTVTGTLTVTPIIETFSVPQYAEAIPDLSVLKTVYDQTQSIATAGEQIFKHVTGQTIRKIILAVYNSTGGVTDAEIQSNIQLVLKQASIPYSIPAKFLQYVNQQQYSNVLPAGVYVLDFTDQGVPSLGGARDLLDSAKLTELWLRFNVQNTGSFKVITESTTQLLG